MDKPWWTLEINEVGALLGADLKNGLSDAEAAKRLKDVGPNVLPAGEKSSYWELFFKQFCNFIIWVLIGAAGISFFLGEWVDAIAIGAIIVINALLASFQEFKAESSLAALQKLTAPNSRVVRNSALKTIPSAEVVPGDIVFLEAGDLVPADGRIAECSRFAAQEASLTGESVSDYKTAKALEEKELSPGDRENMVFSGTEAVSGNARIIVTGTGLKTEIGKIAELLEKKKSPKTPLEERLERLGRTLVYFCLGIVLVIFAVGIARGGSWIEMLLVAASLAVAAIPEGLPAIVTTALGIGVSRMARRKALVRRLPSVETLGCTSVICTDKTGTLTKNEMNVRLLWLNEKLISVSGEGYVPKGEFKRDAEIILPQEESDLFRVLEAVVLCNNASLELQDGHWKITGDPTEAALLTLAAKGGIRKEEAQVKYPFVAEIPFDSERKRMSVLRKSGDAFVLFVKGAPDAVLQQCNFYWTNGSRTLITDAHRQKILSANQTLAKEGLRVLAIAFRDEGLSEQLHESYENGLTFMALAAMIDPPRAEAKEALAKCREAGIFPVMITGDHKDTGFAIAKELGMVERGDKAISGVELDQMSEKEFLSEIDRIVVYARASADNKLRIIDGWKQLGEIVAMTGDGVNDAPAIKAADIGIAMGVQGSEVTKEAADMVITDDHFASIVNAVEEGRGIYDNIIKFVNYLLASNIAEILVIFFGILIGLTDSQGQSFVPLTPVQLLLLNLITDGFPAIALAVDPLDPGAMRRPPRSPKESIIFSGFAVQLLLISLLVTVAALAMCYFGLKRDAATAHTLTLTTLVTLELVKVQMIRSRYNIGFFSNPWLIVALFGSFAFQLVVIYLPFFQTVFGTVPLKAEDWMMIGSITFLVWVSGSLINTLFKKFRKS